MSDSSFIGYVGDPDFHDGKIVSVEQQDGAMRVRLRGASRKVFEVEFNGVREVRANRPAGMLLYALTEMSAQQPIRRFVFANWDEDSDARLEVDAESFTVREGST